MPNKEKTSLHRKTAINVGVLFRVYSKKGDKK
jgi:hypothetical protein